MDWDEPRHQPTSPIKEDLSTLSIGELEARVVALEAEIVRIKDALAAKRAHEKAASALFKSG
jgi:uncharacterized small protein (DUF1192 family)